jgi:transposase
VYYPTPKGQIDLSSLVKKTKKGHDYYYIVESARVNGKPRIVSQTYIGTLDNVLKLKREQDSFELNPTSGKSIEFGAVIALFDLAERLGIRKIIDEEVGKRSQGLPVGDSILLAAINRAVKPVSKNVFYEEWFSKTVLPNSFPLANSKNLSSQGHWNNMSLISSDTIRRIENKITTKIVKEYNINTECLLFDNTNFITYIDTDNSSIIAKRGKSKEHRSDLRIVGLSLMVSPDNNIPLFHEPYPGNTNDAKRFAEIIDTLKSRCRLIQEDADFTLVFDRGNNSASNIEKLLDKDPFSFYFVGGLKQNQCPELIQTSIDKYEPLKGEAFGETTAFRTTKEVFGIPATIVVTNNPELYKLQMRGVKNNIEKCMTELSALSDKLKEREGGKTFRGPRYTEITVKSKVNSILTAEHMKKIFEYKVETNNGKLELIYGVNNENYEYIQNHVLGKSILFTNRHAWSNEQIVGSYRAQYHVEECFKQMKNTEFLTFVPIRHFKDEHITVHAFYCVLALVLASVLNLEFKQMGYDISINTMLRELSDIKQVSMVLIDNNDKIYKKSIISDSEGMIKEYMEKYNLFRYQTN